MVTLVTTPLITTHKPKAKGPWSPGVADEALGREAPGLITTRAAVDCGREGFSNQGSLQGSMKRSIVLSIRVPFRNP